MSEIQKLKDENKRHLEKNKTLEDSLHNSAYYKEGTYAIQALERGRIIEQQEKEIQKLKNEIQKLKNEIQKLKNENKKLKSNKYISSVKTHNERGAGRKSKLKDHDKEVIKMYRLQGKTIKEISELYNCSVGLIHKIISEKN